MKTKNKPTYTTALAYGTHHVYACTRFFNNTGDILIVRLGRFLWRSDTKQMVTKSQLINDGYEPKK